MLRRTVIAATFALSAVTLGLAATEATVVLKNGQRHTGTLVYKHDANMNLIVDGRERSFPQNEIAVIDLGRGDPSASELRKLPASDNPPELERHLVVLRNGTAIPGKLHDILENDSISFDTKDGERRSIPLGEISRIYLSAPGARSVFAGILQGSTPGAAGTTGQEPPPSGAIVVPANRDWTDTYITVRRGDRLSFEVSGDVKFGTAPEQTAGPNGTSKTAGPGFPVPAVGVGALVARVGNSQPFAIGNNTEPITMPAAGRLFLGVNDDNHPDNSGSFNVIVRPQGRPR
jgi:small nuclear ribonucleoprotein (snRNP)-like protein